jgi:hypothetical protein
MLLYVITSARYFRIQLPLHLFTSGTIALVCYWLVPIAGLEGAAIALIIGNLVRMGGSLVAAWHAQRVLDRHLMMTETRDASLQTSDVT